MSTPARRVFQPSRSPEAIYMAQATIHPRRICSSASCTRPAKAKVIKWALEEGRDASAAKGEEEGYIQPRVEADEIRLM